MDIINSISLKINRLGMIKDSNVELNKLMIFSGESGLGKSYLATLCHYFFDVLLSNNRISSFFEEKAWDFNAMRLSFKNSGIALSISKADFEKWMSKDAIEYLGYMINNKALSADIEVKLPDAIPETINIQYEEELTGLVNDEETYIKLMLPGISYRIKDNEGIHEESPFAFLFRFYLIQMLFGSFRNLESTYVFPPSRGPVLTEEIIPNTGMYEKFRNSIYNLKKAKAEQVSIDPDLRALLKDVLEGDVAVKDNKYIYHTNNVELPLSAAAASIREIAIFEFLVENTDIDKVSLMIEEPEAHLHPLKQRLMADVIACMLKGGASMQVTTHSDYFLRRINELILQYKLKQNNQEKYADICSRLGLNQNLYIDISQLSAYYLVRNTDGTSHVEKQSLDDGVPFSAFRDAIEDSLQLKYELENALDNANY